jgi:topoisomerase-4 subunit B
MKNEKPLKNWNKTSPRFKVWENIDEFKNFIGDYSFDPLWWIEHIDWAIVVFLHGKKYMNRQEFIIKELEVELDVIEAV